MSIQKQEYFEKLLKQQSLRITPHRVSTLLILDRENLPMTTEQILEISEKRKDPIPLSTLYRTLTILTESGLLERTVTLSGLTAYQLKSASHKHVIQCSICNKVVAIETCPIADLEAQIQKETSFILTGHNLEFTGICPDCAHKIDQ